MRVQRLGVLLLANSFFPRVDGSVLAVGNEMTLLKARGHRVCLVTRRHKDTNRFEIWKGFPIFRVSSDAHGLLTRAKTALEQALLGFLLCRRSRISVIHAHGAVPLAAGLLVSKLCRKPLVVTFHGFQRLWSKGTIWKSESELKLTYPIIKLMVGWADVVIAQSKPFGEAIVRLYKADPSRIFVLPHVIDEENFTFVPNPPFKKPVVLFVGALARVYGVDLFIKAASLVVKNHPNVKFLIVGEGPLRSKLSKMISRLDLEDSVLLVGPIYNRKKLARYYQTAKVVVIPQKYKGYFLSLVAMEALAAGRPIVTTQILDPELYRQVIFKATFDPKDIAEKIMQILILTKKSYTRLAKSARNHFDIYCSKSVVASKLETLYLTLCHSQCRNH